MSVIGVNDNSSLNDLYQTYLSQSNSTTSTDDSLSNTLSKTTTSESAVDSIVLSSKGQIYSRLKQLQASDPDKFKEVCSEIATKLEASSKKLGGSGATELAAKFEKAAKNGDMSSLTTATSTSTSSSTTKSSLVSSLSQYYEQFGSSNQSSNDILIQAILNQAGIS